MTPIFDQQAFTDSHMMMSTLGAKNEELTMKLLNSLKTYVRYSIIPDMTSRRLRLSLGRGVELHHEIVSRGRGSTWLPKKPRNSH